jgi:NRPS condensation-like uncharacterized protein
MQEGMLFHAVSAPHSRIYQVLLIRTIRGNLDVPAFERAWQQVVDRHPILRTHFLWEGLKRPVQVVQRRLKVTIQTQDYRRLSPTDQKSKLREYVETDRVQGFKLSDAPLMRLTLIRLAEDSYQFVWSYHHLLLDGWSLSLIIKEVSTFYAAFCQGRELLLEPSRPFRDYIAWLQLQDLSKAEAFWRRALKGFTIPTRLSVSQSPKGSSPEGQDYYEQRRRLSAEITAGLRSMARKHQLTLNTLLLGAWALLLSRYSGEEDVLFGTVVSGRPAELSGVASLVGLFINTLPVRALE